MEKKRVKNQPARSLAEQIGRGHWANAIYLWLSAFLLGLGTVMMIPHGDFRDPAAVPSFWLGAIAMSFGFVISWLLTSVRSLWFWGVAIALRLLLLKMYPGDDIWRYLWEGSIQNLGFSPYDFPPDAIALIPHRPEWWSQINHPSTTAIYPPLTQLGFRLLAAINPSVLLFKLSFIVADLLTCWLLSRRFGNLSATFYAWNPLILYSFAGGGHYDAWFVLPLVAAWLVLDSPAATADPGANFMHSLRVAFADEDEELEPPPPSTQKIPPWRWLASAFLLGLSTAIKWMSLPLLGFLAWQAFRKTGLKLAALVVLCGLLPMVVLALPFCHGSECPLIPTGSVFVSHGRSAELVPYLLGKFWNASRKANWIYLIPLGAIGLAMLWKIRHFRPFAEGYFFVLLALSPIVHAWYFTWLIPFAVASRNLGTYWLSLSAFVYFALPHRQALGNSTWFLSETERLWLWLPLLLGGLWTVWGNRLSQKLIALDGWRNGARKS